MSKFLINVILSYFIILLLILESINGISLQEAYFVHQKVKAHINKPRVLSENYGPVWHDTNSPVLHIDPVTGDVTVLKPQLTLNQILEKARQKLQKELPNQQRPSRETEESPTINRFNHLRPNIIN
uniref:Uncharacterized protein n=1 Tax=Panagrolaimus davidi TaxID=227884 RepID=A0A914PW83_9BILA